MAEFETAKPGQDLGAERAAEAEAAEKEAGQSAGAEGEANAEAENAEATAGAEVPPQGENGQDGTKEGE